MGRSDKNFEGRRAQIIEAATAVFATHGYQGASNKRIAEELARRSGAGVTPQLIYHYFEGKQALFQAVMQQFPPPQRVRAAIEQAMDEPPDRFFRRVARAYLALLDDPQAAAVIRITILESEQAPEVAQTVAAALVPAYAEPMIAYLAAGVARGLLRPCSPGLVLLGLFGPLLQSRSPVSRAMAQRMNAPPLDADALVDGVVDNLLLGLVPRGPTP
jgi:AcrR family transcriptional regulator